MLTKRQRYNLLLSQLKTERATFESFWRDLGDNISPKRVRFTQTDSNKGDRRNQKIIDSSPTFAARTLASGMMSGITSPARSWFRLTVPDPDLAEQASVKAYCDEVTQRMRVVFNRSNLYNKLPTLYNDLGVFSTGVMAVLEDDDSIIRCQDYPVGSYYLANDSRLRVRVFMREFRMTVRQVVERFGIENTSEAVQRAYANKSFEEWVNVVHVIAPNEDYDAQRIRAKYKQFTSCYFESAQVGSAAPSDAPDTFLEESGFDEFPVLAARWETTGEDVYGTNGPGMTALGDIKMLQAAEKKGYKALDKSIDPPLQAPPELRNNRVSLLPGDITYVAQGTNSGIRPVHEVRLALQELEAKQQQTRARIDRAFFADLFLMLTYADATRGQQPLTATEINERHEEKLLALGPVLEQLNQDVLDPLIDRTFAIMARRGLLPDPPQELEGMPLKVEYVSIMAQAQKAIGLASLERFASFVGNTVQQTEHTEILDKINFDNLVDEYADGAGIPSRVLVSDDDVAATRKARADAQAQQAASEQAPAVAQTAKNLSQTPLGGNTALAALLGNGIGRPVAA